MESLTSKIKNLIMRWEKISKMKNSIDFFTKEINLQKLSSINHSTLKKRDPKCILESENPLQHTVHDHTEHRVANWDSRGKYLRSKIYKFSNQNDWVLVRCISKILSNIQLHFDYLLYGMYFKTNPKYLSQFNRTSKVSKIILPHCEWSHKRGSLEMLKFLCKKQSSLMRLMNFKSADYSQNYVLSQSDILIISVLICDFLFSLF